jgi:histidyl-tRNA synthetase
MSAPEAREPSGTAPGSQRRAERGGGSRPTPLSGFPEWLPAERIVEQRVLDRIRRTFELWGFSPLETRAVEPLTDLLRKGEIDKEVYVLRRLQADPEADGDAGLALHFDLTVPFARYVLERSGHLQFPFRRYQIQKCWRGERPQEGRYREFTQADIDVVGAGELPAHHEAELPLVVFEALAGLPIPPLRMHVNNRKVSQGFFRSLGLEDLAGVLRIVDKLDKIGPDRVASALTDEVGASPAQAAAVLAFAAITGEDGAVADRVRGLAGAEDPLLEEGLAELGAVLDGAREHAPGMLVADLRIARGLDYYTGTVYETTMLGHQDLGSVCSGGRYDTLASSGTDRYPGVGLSIGVTRLLSRVFSRRLVTASRPVPTCVLVAVPDEERRADSTRIAVALRRRGIATEVSPDAARYGRQIRYADRRGIPFVWFPQDAGGHEVRDIRSGEQVPAEPASWQPPATDLEPQLLG